MRRLLTVLIMLAVCLVAASQETGGLFVIDAENGSDPYDFTDTVLDASTTFAPDGTNPNNGTNSFKTTFDGSGRYGYGYKTISATDEVYVRFYVYIPTGFNSGTGYGATAYFFTANSRVSSEVRFGVETGSGGVPVQWKLYVAGATTEWSDEFALDTWILCEVRYLRGAASNGGAECWINGTKYVTDIDQTMDVALTTANIGVTYTSTAPDNADYILIDDIKADTSYVGAYSAGGATAPLPYIMSQ